MAPPQLNCRSIGRSLPGMMNVDFLVLIAVVGAILWSCGALLWVLLRVMKAP
ncbi:hypothetical protein [Roseixanthobacter glucoisosaccharinicivorans]|uniref:hypothetical protein n=1 Tax=Roseixanthobacter glucoisosaccharinicivorans TaxID=3119923 RepID=UPI00372AEF56